MRHLLLYESFQQPPGFNTQTFTFAHAWQGSDLLRFHLGDGSGGAAIGFLTPSDLQLIQEGLNDIACDEQIWSLLRAAVSGSAESLKYASSQSAGYEIHIEPIDPSHRWLLWGNLPPDLLGDMSDEDREKIGAAPRRDEPVSLTKTLINSQGDMEEIPQYITHDGKDPRLSISPLERQGRSEYPQGTFWAYSSEDDSTYNIPIIPHRVFLFTLYDEGAFEMTPPEFIAYYRSKLRTPSREHIEAQYPEGLSDETKRKFLNFLVQGGAPDDILHRMTRVLY